MRKLAVATMVALGASLLAHPAQASFPSAVDGVVATAFGGTVNPATGVQGRTYDSQARGWLAEGGAFSPDGSILALLQTDSINSRTEVWLRYAQGTERRLTTLNGYEGEGISWTPNGDAVVVAVDADPFATVYRIPVAGVGETEPVKVFEFDGAENGNTIGAEHSPTDDRIAVVSDRYYYWLGRDDWETFPPAESQIWTFPTTGGEGTMFASPCPLGAPTSCDDDDRVYDYHWAEWAPSGDRLVTVVSVYDSAFEESMWIATIGSSGVPELLVDVSNEPFPYPVWSPTGDKIAFASANSEGQTEVRVMPAAGGTPSTVGILPQGAALEDWQPCPTGTCAVFATDSRQPTAIAAKVLASGYCLPTRCVADKIKVTGTIDPAIQVPITVRLKSQKRGQWVLDGTRSVTSSTSGSFSTAFGKPAGTPCEVVVKFAGNAKYLPSTWTRSWRC